MAEDCVARRVQINGIVQGVGFRPFIHQLANRHHLHGEVANTSAGVSVFVQGALKNVESFYRDLSQNHPPLAHITEILLSDAPAKALKGFHITVSGPPSQMATLISPDISVCDDCLAEMFDPRDRRFQYPFINCTNCGPRYTIIDDTPYDRPKTSMKHFEMCPDCRAEYEDPLNRRFHAQPNACPVCGPRVELRDNRWRDLPDPNPVEKAAALLKQGYIVAIKGLGGFHLAADAENDDAVRALRKRKLREEKPLALMSLDIERIKTYSLVDADEENLLKSPRRPIVLLEKKAANPIASSVAPANRCFGAMLPYTPLHYLLLSHGFTALVMTSGNLSEEPIAIDNREAFDRLSKIADFFLIHNRDIYLRSDDSIVRKSAGSARFLRRSRGFVPVPVFVKHRLPPILACGAELKNTICLTRNEHVFVSQHIGDLENLSTYEFFRFTIEHMQRILDIRPEIIAHDLHPDYLSTRYALEQQGPQKIQVQHHHAHIAAAMAENRIDGPVIGLSFDGTGYGSDGAVWGGEVLLADVQTFSRAAHIAYVPMPGSAAAIKEPWRMAVSYLYDAFGKDIETLDLPFLRALAPDTLKIIVQMANKRLNSPLTSSLGRLFDGIAAMAGVRSRIAFEGQAAMELEMLAADEHSGVYDYEYVERDRFEILTGPIVRGVVRDLADGVPPPVVSRKFHDTLIRLFADLCKTVGRRNGLKRTVLSGGVFQNSLLLNGLMQDLERSGFEVYTHSRVPANDGGICLGQAVVAAAAAGK